MAEQSIPRQRRIQRIQLEPFDDVTSVRDRLQFVQAGRVLLVFPKKGKILKRKLDLVLIQREAARLDLRLAIVTQDLDVIDNAKDIGLSVFYTVEEARTHRWQRAQTKVFVDRRDRPKLQHDPYELMLAASRLKPPPTPIQQSVNRAVRGMVFGIAMLAVLFGAYATLPNATVTLTPARDELNITINLVADPAISFVQPESLRIPATVERRLEESTVTIETTGLRPTENSLAEGVVTFTNNTDLAQFIPQGTIVQTASVPPVQFETQEDAALPAQNGATVNVSIRSLATNTGLSGNQPPETIVRIQGTLDDSISVINQNATYGEGVRDIPYVTTTDHERLQTLARQQIRQNARDTFLVSLDEENFLLVPESIEIVEERSFTYSAEIDQPAQTVTLIFKAVVEATIINLADARLAAFAVRGRYVVEGRKLDETNLIYRKGEIMQVFNDGSIAFQMRIEGANYVDIEPNHVRQRLTGMSVREAQEVLEKEYLLDPHQPPEINTWPGFLNRMPLLPVRIEVNVRENG